MKKYDKGKQPLYSRKGLFDTMRKKSHLSLASYLMKSEGMEVLATHKKAFYWGNILPDCIPSFITRRHTIDETFVYMKKELTLLIEDYNYNQGITGYFCRHLGVLLHYVADFFTYPHNSFYPGTLKDHCNYEKDMKFYMRDYVKTEDAKRYRSINAVTKTVEDICCFIKESHIRYANEKHSVPGDCNFIVSICHRIVDFILNLAEHKNAVFVKTSCA